MMTLIDNVHLPREGVTVLGTVLIRAKLLLYEKHVVSFSSELVLRQFVFRVIGLTFNYSKTVFSYLNLFAGKHRDKFMTIPTSILRYLIVTESMLYSFNLKRILEFPSF